MGFETSSRKRAFPRDWAFRRRLVLERAGFRCVYVRQDTGLPCGAKANQCDHIHPGVNGVYDDSLDNLQALCAYHHLVKSKGEGGRAAVEHRRERVRAKRYEHPEFR